MCALHKFSTDPILPRSLTLVKASISRLNRLPDELLLIIFNQLPNADLLKLRSVNSHLGAIAQEILRFRTKLRMQFLNAEFISVQKVYQDMVDDKKPRLDHFRGFLQQLPITHIQEASWYTVVPHELLTVCECLVILKQGPLTANDPVEKWAEIKKTMSKYEFKSWYINLRENVEDLDMIHVGLVQNIIMHDSTITYERVHEVSICAYQMLIAIAASLQFATISQDMNLTKNKMFTLQVNVQKSMRFLNAL